MARGKVNPQVEFASDRREREIVEVAANPEVLREILRTDHELFIRFMLDDLNITDVPPYQLEMFRLFTSTNPADSRVAVAMPRGHVKTTMVKVAAVYLFLYSDWDFILYCSGTKDLVTPYVLDVAQMMTTENFTSVYGETKFSVRQEGNGFYLFELGFNKKSCILRGIGAGQRIRGLNIKNRRPQVVLADDIEDSDDTTTPKAHDKLKSWWFGPFIKALSPANNAVRVTGNLIARVSLLQLLLESPLYKSKIFGCIRGNGQPLWPEMFPLEKLLAEYKDYQRNGEGHTWLAEMQNTPSPKGGAVCDISQILYLPARLPQEVANNLGFITVDPAFTANAGSDAAAVTVSKFISDVQRWQTVEVSKARARNLGDLWHRIQHLADKWFVKAIGIEVAGVQVAIVEAIQNLAWVNARFDLTFFPLPTHNVAKRSRIKAWAQLLYKDNGLFALTEGDFVLTQELAKYDPNTDVNDDNAIDAGAHQLTAVREHMYTITTAGQIVTPGSGNQTFTTSVDAPI